MNESSKLVNFDRVGEDMYRLITALYPICRSITGKGFVDSLDIIQKLIPLSVYQIPSGAQVFDWIVPKEWNITDAYVKNSHGERVIDFKQSNLHVLNYSMPMKGNFSLDELRDHLFSLPDFPDWIPYKTSYYKEGWGFCLSHNQLEAIEDGYYDVCIESSLENGVLTYGEYYLPGVSEEEVLISCHACHPSLCNDNLSGVALATFLAKSIEARTHRYSYRFLFIPGTIGSITWLAQNEEQVSKIRHGLVVACVGDSGKPHYKKSRRGNAEIDRAVCQVLKHSGESFELEEFTPYGYDERQYCSPGFNLPVGCLSRTPHGRYPEYHTSADNLSLISPIYLADSLRLYHETIFILENNRKYINTNPKGEPHLGKRGLFSTMGGHKELQPTEMALLWALNLSDGQHDLLDISEKSGLEFREVYKAVETLSNNRLLFAI